MTELWAFPPFTTSDHRGQHRSPARISLGSIAFREAVTIRKGGRRRRDAEAPSAAVTRRAHPVDGRFHSLMCLSLLLDAEVRSGAPGNRDPFSLRYREDDSCAQVDRLLAEIVQVSLLKVFAPVLVSYF